MTKRLNNRLHGATRLAKGAVGGNRVSGEGEAVRGDQAGRGWQGGMTRLVGEERSLG